MLLCSSNWKRKAKYIEKVRSFQTHQSYVAHRASMYSFSTPDTSDCKSIIEKNNTLFTLTSIFQQSLTISQAYMHFHASYPQNKSFYRSSFSTERNFVFTKFEPITFLSVSPQSDVFRSNIIFQIRPSNVKTFRSWISRSHINHEFYIKVKQKYILSQDLYILKSTYIRKIHTIRKHNSVKPGISTHN